MLYTTVAFGGIEGYSDFYSDEDVTRLPVELRGGLKARASENGAERVGYRFRHVRDTRIGPISDQSGPVHKGDFASHGVFFGLSVFLNPPGE